MRFGSGIDPRRPGRGRAAGLTAAAIAALAVLAPAAAAQRDSGGLSPQALAAAWDAEHVSPPLPPLLDHAAVLARLDALTASAPDLFHVEPIGQSVEGRSLNDVRVGTGAKSVLLWSQMHGDEPTATAALFDVFDYLRTHRDDPPVRRLLSELTLHVVPMLNPDGAERYQRRNAQGIDINRDALRLQTPEGRALKSLRDRVEPMLGFNLHNQGWRTSVGSPPMPATISLLSVAYDEARSENAGRRLTKRVCAVIADSLQPYASGQIGKYDDEFEVRAFGDNLTLWGTPVVLIETGAYPAAEPDPAVVRLNFIAILSALDAVASGAVDEADPKRYDELPTNDSRELYAIIRNATVITGGGVPPFLADVGLVASRRVTVIGGERQMTLTLTVEDIGDLRTLGALRTIDATGMTVVPMTGEPLEQGATVALPEWRTVVSSPIAVSQPARLAVLAPAEEPGRYRVAFTFE